MRRLLLLFLCLTMLGLTSCEEAVKTPQRVLGFIANTEKLSRSFTYEEIAGEKQLMIEGRIEDSFRYQESLRINGTDVMEQVVSDDSMAIRIIDATKVPDLAGDPAVVPVPGFAIVSQSLLAGDWVIDPSGAPAIYRGGTELDQVGVDPLADAVEVLRYVRVSIATAFDVKEYREEDLDPAYRPSEDPFPKPDGREGIRRFDLVRPFLPRPTGSGQGPQNAPQTRHFRKMAIYVKGNLVVKVMEEIDVEGHEDFKEARRKGNERVLEILESVRRGLSQERIRPRKMTVDFAFGSFTVSKPEGLQASIGPQFQQAGYGGIFSLDPGGYAPTGGAAPVVPEEAAGEGAPAEAPEGEAPGSESEGG